MSTTKFTVGVIGGAGYTGGETIRLLLNHLNVEISFVQSRSQAGKPITSVHRDLAGESELIFVAEPGKADVWFLCLGHGESVKFLQQHNVPATTKIINLSQDFRIKDGKHDFVYGLPEAFRDQIKSAKHLANPGCFATAIQLGLLPLAKAGLLETGHTTGITGSTGAGQKLQDTTHFTWRANNISAYKTLQHQHLAEIRQTLSAIQPGFTDPIHFVPWRGDFTRGIFVTSVLTTAAETKDFSNLYREYYQSHPFVVVSEDAIDLKQVVNTNKCIIQIERQGQTVAIHSAIDNLLKGASGQAVQNMNLMLGLPEIAGLHLKPVAF